jgi:hypothetical protein
MQLGSTWYHYCNVPETTITALIEAESAGRYFNGNMRGKFDCRRTRRRGIDATDQPSVGLRLFGPAIAPKTRTDDVVMAAFVLHPYSV